MFITFALAVGVTIDGPEPPDSIDPDHEGTPGRYRDGSHQSHLFKRNCHRDCKCRRSADLCLRAGWVGHRDDRRRCNVRRYVARATTHLGWPGREGVVEQSLWRPLYRHARSDPSRICLCHRAICPRRRSLQPDAVYPSTRSAPGPRSHRSGIAPVGALSPRTRAAGLDNVQTESNASRDPRAAQCIKTVSRRGLRRRSYRSGRGASRWRTGDRGCPACSSGRGCYSTSLSDAAEGFEKSEEASGDPDFCRGRSAHRRDSGSIAFGRSRLLTTHTDPAFLGDPDRSMNRISE